MSELDAARQRMQDAWAAYCRALADYERIERREAAVFRALMDKAGERHCCAGETAGNEVSDE